MTYISSGHCSCGCLQFVKIHQAVHLRYMYFWVYVAYFNKTFTKNHSGFSHEMDSRELRAEVGRSVRKPSRCLGEWGGGSLDGAGSTGENKWRESETPAFRRGGVGLSSDLTSQHPGKSFQPWTGLEPHLSEYHPDQVHGGRQGRNSGNTRDREVYPTIMNLFEYLWSIY